MSTLPERLLFTPEMREQFNAWQSYEAEAFAEKARPNGGNRPSGARLSIQCPVASCKAQWDPWFCPPIDEGDGERGHAMERLFMAIVLHGSTFLYQPVVAWELGTTAFDWHVTKSLHPLLEGRTIDLKSTIGRMSMRDDWKVVTQRRMVADKRQVGDEVDIWIVHPGNMRVAGPKAVVLTQEAHERETAIIDAMCLATAALAKSGNATESDGWDDREWWTTLGLDCTCGGCLSHTKVDADAALERLGRRYEMVIAAAELEALRVGAKITVNWGGSELRQQIEDAARIRLRGAIEAGEPGKIQTWRGDRGLDICWQPKNESFAIRRRKAVDAAPVVETVIVDGGVAA